MMRFLLSILLAPCSLLLLPSIALAKEGAPALAKKGAPASLASKPNVLFIVCDDLNTHLAYDGYEAIKTPHLDAFAKRALTFERAYCQYPVCNPSRSSFLSGRYPETTGVLDNRKNLLQLQPGLVTIPRHFRDNGYWTGGVGKVFHGKWGTEKPLWDEFHKFDNDHNPVLHEAELAFEREFGSIHEPENTRKWKQRQRELRQSAGGQTPPGKGPTRMTDAQHKDGKNARQIVKWLNEKPHRDKPFFLACGIHKPHVPFWAPQKYFDLYPLEKIQPAAVPEDDWGDIPPLAMNKRFEAFGFRLDASKPDLAREYMQAYHACISFLDAQLGLIFKALDEHKLWDDTVVVFFSDHGYHLGEHFMWGKVTLFEECARVPLVIHAPGRTTPGSRTAALAELVDLFPTLNELCGLPKPGGLQGASLVPVMKDPSLPGKPAAYTVVTRGQSLGRSIRTPFHRYAEWGGPSAIELYNLRSDPREHTNLAGDDRFHATVSKHRDLLMSAKAHANP